MRIRVQVDVSKPLCRGPKVVFEDGKEGWVAFKHEKLPNFCYWCGLVSHDDKDCEHWLSSKGTLVIESQEFGTWLRAPIFNFGKKSVVIVEDSGKRFMVFLHGHWWPG